MKDTKGISPATLLRRLAWKAVRMRLLVPEVKSKPGAIVMRCSKEELELLQQLTSKDIAKDISPEKYYGG